MYACDREIIKSGKGVRSKKSSQRRQCFCWGLIDRNETILSEYGLDGCSAQREPHAQVHYDLEKQIVDTDRAANEGVAREEIWEVA